MLRKLDEKRLIDYTRTMAQTYKEGLRQAIKTSANTAFGKLFW